MHNIVVAGGDTRDIWLAHMLKERGHRVWSWGMRDSGIPPYGSNDPNPDVFIGPMTGIDEGGVMETIDGPLVMTPEWLDRMAPQGLVAAGLLADPVLTWCRDRQLKTVEYRQLTSFMWLNAVPTAEGALKAAIGLSGYTLFGRPLGIIGFGRVGLVLADRLQRYGSEPIVFERHGEKRAMARALGFKAYSLEVWPLPEVDGVFNTVPAPVLDQHWFEGERPFWVIDLASMPGGLIPQLRDNPLVASRYQHILSIPGKIAPVRAAEIIWETLALWLEEEWRDEKISRGENWDRHGGFAL
ncbi:MAG: dipicolinate synthase subunit DpsA [Firmicutes bacterium]|nr:dipicolinate synthase subunit DpsA [Bacillota bacterium]